MFIDDNSIYYAYHQLIEYHIDKLLSYWLKSHDYTNAYSNLSEYTKKGGKEDVNNDTIYWFSKEDNDILVSENDK